nr:hypothetical protein [Tanacetum cinerariifolium]
MSHHKKIFVSPSLTKKVFANMKRERKGFSRIFTPLFATMMVQAPEDIGKGSKVPTDTHHTPIVTKPSSSQPQKKQKSRKKQRKETKVPHTEPQTEESVPTTSNDPLPSEESQEAREEEIVKEFRFKKIMEGRMNEEDMFGVNDLDGDEVIVNVTTGENVEQSSKDAEKEVSIVDPVTTDGEVVTTAENVEVTIAAITP